MSTPSYHFRAEWPNGRIRVSARSPGDGPEGSTEPRHAWSGRAAKHQCPDATGLAPALVWVHNHAHELVFTSSSCTPPPVLFPR